MLTLWDAIIGLLLDTSLYSSSFNPYASAAVETAASAPSSTQEPASQEGDAQEKDKGGDPKEASAARDAERSATKDQDSEEVFKRPLPLKKRTKKAVALAEEVRLQPLRVALFIIIIIDRSLSHTACRL